MISQLGVSRHWMCGSEDMCEENLFVYIYICICVLDDCRFCVYFRNMWGEEDMYMCMYIHAYVYVYIYMYIYDYIYMYVYIYIDVYM